MTRKKQNKRKEETLRLLGNYENITTKDLNPLILVYK